MHMTGERIALVVKTNDEFEMKLSMGKCLAVVHHLTDLFRVAVFLERRIKARHVTLFTAEFSHEDLFRVMDAAKQATSRAITSFYPIGIPRELRRLAEEAFAEFEHDVMVEVSP